MFLIAVGRSTQAHQSVQKSLRAKESPVGGRPIASRNQRWKAVCIRRTSLAHVCVETLSVVLWMIIAEELEDLCGRVGPGLLSSCGCRSVVSCVEKQSSTV